MVRSWMFTVALLPLTVSCGDGVGPPLELTEFELCSKPSWIFVSNGSSWQSIDVPDPQIPFGPVRISARVAPRTSVAIGYSPSVQVYQVLQEELDQLRCQPSFASGPFRSVTGTVAGIPATEIFQMAYAQHSGSRTGPGTFGSAIRDTIATILATHRPSGSLKSAGVLVVRDFNSIGQSAFPALDFASPDTRALDSAQLTLSGAAPGASIFRSTTLQTGGTTLSLESSSSALPASYYALTGPGHPDDVYSASFNSGSKAITWYYGGLSGSATVAFGPDLPAITAQDIVHPRLCKIVTASFSVQPELESGARVVFQFGSGRFFTSVSVFVSRGFRGTNDNWEAQIPDFGPDATCAYQPTTASPTITATAYGGNIRLQLGVPPVAGDLIRSVTVTRAGP